MGQLQVTQIDIARFTYVKEVKRLIADVTDLDTPVDRLHQRLYDDACDVGFAVHNPSTGNTVRFGFEKVEKKDNELIAWHFLPTPESVRRGTDPRLKVVIYND